jgi:hypothetical protein
MRSETNFEKCSREFFEWSGMTETVAFSNPRKFNYKKIFSGSSHSSILSVAQLISEPLK